MVRQMRLIEAQQIQDHLVKDLHPKIAVEARCSHIVGDPILIAKMEKLRDDAEEIIKYLTERLDPKKA